MDDVKILDIKESSTVGRWVLATIGGYDDSVYYELTFAPDLTPEEWGQIDYRLPRGFLVEWLYAVSGEMLGRSRALMARIA